MSWWWRVVVVIACRSRRVRLLQIQIQINLCKQKSGQWTHRSRKTLTHAQQKKITQQWNTQACVNSTIQRGVKSTNSSLCLHTEMLLALTISLDKLFQISITRWAKLYFRTSRLHWGLNKLRLCPLVILVILVLRETKSEQVSCSCVHEQHCSKGLYKSDLIRLVRRTSIALEFLDVWHRAN